MYRNQRSCLDWACREQQVRVLLPEGKNARKVQLLVSGRAPAVRPSPGSLAVTVPSIRDHEVVAIDL